MSPGATRRACWCGEGGLSPFGGGYLRCEACGTLVGQQEVAVTAASGEQGPEAAFYGRHYWGGHQEGTLGLPPIAERARLDLPQRCLHWLQALLAHRVPPGRVLEVGCGHGGYVALLHWAGFDATGLELSPWVVDFARRTFDVPVLLGPLESQALPAGAFAAVVMNDVVEHLEDPLSTLRAAAALLEPAGMLAVQTPRAPEDGRYEELARAGDSFLRMLEEPGHLYLFTRRALGRLLERAGLAHVRDERPCFGYDMFVFASRQPVGDVPAETVEAALQARPSGRLVQALLDKARESESRRQRSIAQLLGPTVSRRLLAVLRRLRLV